MIVPVILSGGSGTRLWPLSRKLYPKQFLNLVNDTSLFQDTISRLPKSVSDPLIICNEEHRFIVAEQLREIKSKSNENSFAGFGDPEFNSKKDIKLASKSDLSNLTMSRGVAGADEIRKLSELPETSDEL